MRTSIQALGQSQLSDRCHFCIQLVRSDQVAEGNSVPQHLFLPPCLDVPLGLVPFFVRHSHPSAPDFHALSVSKHYEITYREEERKEKLGSPI